MIRRAFEELAAADGADEFAVADGDLAADGDDSGAAFDGPAFEAAVVDVHHLRGGGDFSAVGGVVDDEVRIGARLDGAFFREETEELRGLRAGNVDEGVEIEATGFNAVGVEEVYAILEGGD